MATNTITFNKSSLTSDKSYVLGKIEYSYTQSQDDNTSTITCNVYVKKDNDNTKLTVTTTGTFKYSLRFNGETITGSKSLTILTSYVKIGSFTRTITHNDDGSKSFSVSGSVWLSSNSSSAYYNKKSSVSTAITLNTIPRASTIDSLSCNTSYFDGTFTYKYTPQSASYYNRCNISLNINEDFTVIKSINIGTKSASQQTATVTLSSAELTTIYKKLPTDTSGTLRFTFRTYSDSGYNTQVGSASYKEVKLNIPTSIKPSIGTITLDPVNITTADGTSRDVLVKGKNKLTVSVSGCAAGTGSSIVSYTFSGTNISSTKSSTSTSASVTSSTISTSGTLTYTVKITDKRGRTASKSATITCYNYDAPEFSSFTVYRCNSSGTASDSGTYIKYELATKYSSVNSTNKNTVKIYYKKSTDSSWSTAANALTGSTAKSAEAIIKNSSGTAISSFNADSTYLVYAVLTDNYNGSVQSAVVNVFGASRILNVRKSGTGIAFGKMAENDNLFEVKWPLKVNDQITFGSNATQSRLYCDNTDGKNIVYIQTGQSISGGTTMGLALHAGVQSGSTESSSPCVYVENSANSGKVNLGNSGRKWNQLYAANATISTSDRNLKTNIADMSNTQEQLFNKLRPVTFEFINGSSGRTHYGFISQDVEDSLNELGLKGTDFAGFCKDMCVDESGVEILDESGNKTYDYALRYSEFIALNTYMIQKLQNKIIELEAEIAELKRN